MGIHGSGKEELGGEWGSVWARLCKSGGDMGAGQWESGRGYVNDEETRWEGGAWCVGLSVGGVM